MMSRAPRRRSLRSASGFTLVEMIIVIVISGIIAGILAVVIVGPMQGYESQSRRAELVDLAESALRRIERDIRQALPNSIRVDATGRVLEMLSTVDGGRYCANLPCAPAAATCTTPAGNASLRFNTADTAFDVVGELLPSTPGTAGLRLVVYNLGQPGGDAYAGTDVISPAGTTVTIATSVTSANDCITLNPGFRFRFESPSQRFYLVNTPVTYLCNDTGAGTNPNTMTRYAGYSINSTQPTDPTAMPLSSATAIGRAATRVTACAFTYQPGVSQRAGVVTMTLTISEAGEQVRLLHQVHVYNTP